MSTIYHITKKGKLFKNRLNSEEYYINIEYGDAVFVKLVNEKIDEILTEYDQL